MAGIRAVSTQAFGDEDMVVRVAGETLAMSPPLIVTEDQIGQMFQKLGRGIKNLA